LLRKNRRAGDLFAMTTLTQTLKRRQAVVKYSLRYGVTKASIRYNVSRPTIYKWRKLYSFEAFQKQLAVWQWKDNDFPIRPLKWRSPKDVLYSFPICKV
ncbi:MAG: helix-turn-helix domain-containing protein, partial [Oscillospiraceae bacterium]|nr:helix-turn-helix domain-containing protein [Oscillospiraceae bacterium]